MLSVVIPTRESEEGLARTLASLVSGAAEGVVREVVVVDDSSTDGTRIVADAAGCTLIDQPGGWLGRVAAGIATARRAPWYLVLEPNVFLEGDWFREAAAFVDRIERLGRAEDAVACFRLVYDEFGWRPRLAERLIGVAGALLAPPLRQQGLLISRRHWERLAAPLAPTAGHARLVARLGRGAVHVLRADAVVLPPGDDVSAVPSPLALAGHALAGLGLPFAIGD